MIRIAISVEAFEAIARTLPVGSMLRLPQSPKFQPPTTHQL